MYVYNPRNFHVRYSDNTNWANGSDTANSIIPTLRDVKNERSFGASYHNNTGRDLYVFAGSYSNGMGIEISGDNQNWVSIANNGHNWAVWGLIPRNWFYRIGGNGVYHWYESRY
ncbi:ribonuclease I [Ensifer sp. KUDG1]|uniref:hypothetical protein n=1 Tax=Ensifer sp. KUDG1 TaxID=3373919 RepID=UPI003D1A3A27